MVVVHYHHALPPPPLTNTMTSHNDPHHCDVMSAKCAFSKNVKQVCVPHYAHVRLSHYAMIVTFGLIKILSQDG